MSTRRLKDVCSWRITAAEPSGMMMWFDPHIEVPLLGYPSPDSAVNREGRFESDHLKGTGGGEKGNPTLGGETKTSGDFKDEDLPF